MDGYSYNADRVYAYEYNGEIEDTEQESSYSKYQEEVRRLLEVIENECEPLPF